ncbi:DM13 domain-containing protein [uncultured Thiodictyon sp.]|uniref:DM13 domain-containing protein n=1 Tax=uncultured Thiodictyon sp. TaxID=1846217 RepID=UPI0025F445B4|nr:DM13 domain-containing protein [uncultured Thiodictyon sp.]
MSRLAPRGPATDPARGWHLVVGLLIGAAVGSGAGYYLAVHSRSASVADTGAVTAGRAGAIRATGHFTQADPADRIHYGSGALTLYDDRVELGEDFAVGPGPKYHLYLVPQRGVDADTRVEETMFIDLGPLKSFSGAQGYAIPAGVAVGDYGTVAVWSEQFNTLISPAELVLESLSENERK